VTVAVQSVKYVGIDELVVEGEHVTTGGELADGSVVEVFNDSGVWPGARGGLVGGGGEESDIDGQR
jgi:hypothetical protein